MRLIRDRRLWGAGFRRIGPTVRFVAMAMASALLAAGQQSAITRLDGSTISAAEIDATVTRLMKGAEVVGAGIAVFDHGKIAYLKAYGFRDKEKNLPLTIDSVMSAASLSKVAFGYLAMQLVDEGALDLDKPVYQYLPKPLPELPPKPEFEPLPKLLPKPLLVLGLPPCPRTPWPVFPPRPPRSVCGL